MQSNTANVPPMYVLKAVLIWMIIYIPNGHLLHADFAFKGLNTLNLLFIVAMLLVMFSGPKTKTPAPLKPQLYLFFAVLTWGFLVGQMYDSSTWLEDATELKNAVFYILLFFLFYTAVHDFKT